MKLLDQARQAFYKKLEEFINKNEKDIVKKLKSKAEKEYKQGKISKQEYDFYMKIKTIKADYKDN